MSTSGKTASTWAPLRIGIFRALWLAVLVSNIGSWMQTVGAQWLLVNQLHAAILVRSALFLVPASALWALRPLVASQRLGLGANGYGLLLGALGVGAVAGASRSHASAPGCRATPCCSLPASSMRRRWPRLSCFQTPP